MYKMVLDIMGANKENFLPKTNSYMELAENCADFFIWKIQKIRDSVEQYKWFEPTNHINKSVLHPIV